MRVLRGIRGATTVERDEREEIRNASFELFTQMLSENGLSPDDIAGVLITVTPDIHSAFPAEVIREREDFRYIPMLCAQEMEVEGAPERCIRMLVLAYTAQGPREIRHVYLRGAQSLRRDLVRGEGG
ncbi:MAG: chorismate mutase [Candidatus Caldatribacteriaceae bacterium]